MEQTTTQQQQIIRAESEATEHDGGREAFLREILGVDYDFAADSGLIDLFEYNSETGVDGLAHILVGDEFTFQDGSKVVGGFHHEPSAKRADSRPDQEEMASRSKKRKLDFRKGPGTENGRGPYISYGAVVSVRGFEKKVRVDDKNGSRETRSSSTMFPKEYDALTIMQAVRIALESRDETQDRNEGDVIIADSTAPMLDGERRMKLRVVLDKNSKKVIAAFPLLDRGKEARKSYTADEVARHLGLASLK